MFGWLRDLFREDRLFGAKRDSKWPSVRKAYFAKFPDCAVCGTEKDIQIHHQIPVHVDKSKELDEENLISLCSDHHLWIGHLGSYFSWNESVEEDALIWQDRIKNRP